jgi:hypothetical protein
VIRTTVLNNTLHRCGWRAFRRWEYTNAHQPDGTMTGTIRWSKGSEVTRGTWDISDEGLHCRQWDNQWGDGEIGCFRVRRNGQSLVFTHVSGSSGEAEQYTYQLSHSCK